MRGWAVRIDGYQRIRVTLRELRRVAVKRRATPGREGE